MNVLKDTYAPVKLPLDILDNYSEIYLNYLRRVCVLFVHAFRSAVANLAPTISLSSRRLFLVFQDHFSFVLKEICKTSSKNTFGNLLQEKFVGILYYLF